MNKLVLFLIRVYRFLFSFSPRHCIYTPTCSAYAQEAFQRYSFSRAAVMTVKRILRCHPFARGGIDPVS